MTEDHAAGQKLRSTIERVERLEEEVSNLKEDIKEVYQEAKAFGFDPKIIRKIVRIRKMAEDARREEEMLLETYMSSIGMQ